MSEPQENLQCAIVYPRSDKVDRVSVPPSWPSILRGCAGYPPKIQLKKIMGDIVASVQEQEPCTLKYEVYFGSRPGSESIMIVMEKYKDQHSLEHHRLGPKLGDLKRCAVDEGLFARPPEIIPLALAGEIKHVIMGA